MADPHAGVKIVFAPTVELEDEKRGAHGISSASER
jgi:hypothetical protein